MSHFRSEIWEQPEVLARILADKEVAGAAARLEGRAIRTVLTLARGSSDNAVTFFAYLAGRYLGLLVASVPPSLFTVYGSRLDVAGALAVGVSQSGESPDVVESLRAVRAGGALAVAVSNAPGSSLEQVADLSLRQQAGPERAVAASKTFSSQMLLLALLVAHWSGDGALLAALRAVPEAMRRFLADTEALERAALRLTHAESLYVLGRGLSSGPAQEVALKLKETSYLHAQAYSSAEFQHGPIAAVDVSDPVLLLALADETLASNRDVAARLADLGADVSVVGSDPELLGRSSAAVPLPESLHPVTEAFVLVLAGQLLALHLTVSKGLDPDAPRHLSKVTRTM